MPGKKFTQLKKCWGKPADFTRKGCSLEAFWKTSE